MKILTVAYGNLFSNQWTFTTFETEVFKYNFSNFYITKTMLCILLKFVPDLKPEFMPCRRHIGPHVDASCFCNVQLTLSK